MFEHTVRATLEQQAEHDAQRDAIEQLPPRDPKTGKFLARAEIADDKQPAADKQPANGVPTDGQPAAQPEGQPAGQPAGQPEAQAEGEAPALPDGYVAAPSLPEQRAQGFKVRDGEGEVEAPDLSWEIATATGPRVYSTDQLVNLARQGNYNHELQSRYQTALEAAQNAGGQLKELQTYAQKLEERYIEAMGSDEAYLAARAQWQAANTPEQLLQRERARAAEAEQRVELVQLQAHGQQYFSQTMQPAIQQIAQALPRVSADEIGMRLLMLTDHLRMPTPVGSMYPATAYSEVEAALLRDVVPWAQQLHMAREADAPKPTKDATQAAEKARQEAEQARIRAQKARRQASVGTRPMGTAAAAQPGNGARPSPSGVRSAKDAEAAVIGATMASMRGQ